MKPPVLAAILGLLACAACRDVQQVAVGPAVSSLLDAYSVKARPGQRVGEAKLVQPNLRFPRAGPIFVAPVPRVDGFGQLELRVAGIYYGLEPPEPSANELIEHVILYASDSSAASKAEIRVRAVLGAPTGIGCVYTVDNADAWRNQVIYWQTAAGGVGISFANRRAGTFADYHRGTTLYFWGGAVASTSIFNAPWHDGACLHPLV